MASERDFFCALCDDLLRLFGTSSLRNYLKWNIGISTPLPSLSTIPCTPTSTYTNPLRNGRKHHPPSSRSRNCPPKNLTRGLHSPLPINPNRNSNSNPTPFSPLPPSPPPLRLRPPSRLLRLLLRSRILPSAQRPVTAPRIVSIPFTPLPRQHLSSLPPGRAPRAPSPANAGQHP